MSEAENYGVSLLVGIVVLIAFGGLMIIVLYSALAIRELWRWLTGNSGGTAHGWRRVQK